jgi:hypothetical protein
MLISKFFVQMASRDVVLAIDNVTVEIIRLIHTEQNT